MLHLSHLHPGNPSEVAQRRKDEVREPRPNEHSGHYPHEPLVAADGPAVRLRRIARRMVVQRVHEADVYQSRRPNHSSWFDQPFAHSPSEAEADALRRQGEQDVEAPAEGSDVVEFLDGYHLKAIGVRVSECLKYKGSQKSLRHHMTTT